MESTNTENNVKQHTYRLKKIVNHLVCDGNNSEKTKQNYDCCVQPCARSYALKNEIMPCMSECNPIFTQKLQKIFGNRYTENIKIRNKFGREVIGVSTRVTPPQGVVYPLNTDEIIKFVKLCNEYKIPMIPFAAGTSLESHIIPLNGGITISFDKMNALLKIYPKDHQCTVQPGINWVHLNELLQPYQLFLGVF